LRILVLGSAAGGGLPQWNCACANCSSARAGRLKPRSQSSIAASADGERWLLVNATPDVRSQIEANPQLHPRSRVRGSPIADVILTSADIDCVAGLLTLREMRSFRVHAARPVLDALARNPILRMSVTPQRALALDEPFEAAGLVVTPFAVPGKPPLWLEGEAAPDPADAIGLELRKGGRRVVYVPGCAAVTESLSSRVEGASALFFDGAFWRDDEMLALGLGERTGRAMGHVSLSGPDGALARLGGLKVGRKLLIHVNNSNPALDPTSAEAGLVRRAGFEIPEDGQEIAP
jgi:pyrroloquinoline quinone biosynthesis protein B